MRRVLIPILCLSALPAAAQTVPPHPPITPPPTPPEIVAPKQGGSTSELPHSGVITPPKGVDPELAKPPPPDVHTTMPVIRPPVPQQAPGPQVAPSPRDTPATKP